MVTRRIPLAFFVIVGSITGLAVLLYAQSEQDSHAWGKPSAGLQLSLYLDSQPEQNSSMPVVRVAIMNSGTSAKKIVLGGGCGNVNQTNSISLEVKEEGGTTTSIAGCHGGPSVRRAFGRI